MALASAVPVKVGVVSDVMLSVDDEPVSDDAARSGVEGADGAVASTTSVWLVFVPSRSVASQLEPGRLFALPALKLWPHSVGEDPW